MTNCLFRFFLRKKCVAVVVADVDVVVDIAAVCCCKQEDDPDRRVVENFDTTCFFSIRTLSQYEKQKIDILTLFSRFTFYIFYFEP